MSVASLWYKDSAPKTSHRLIHFTQAMISTRAMSVVARVASRVEVMITGHFLVAIPMVSAPEIRITGMTASFVNQAVIDLSRFASRSRMCLAISFHGRAGRYLFACG